uniref:Putative secreted protein n=1 Tax=Anopheles marajoara TaxID=58244 RepID=A0A2M4C7H2_9DIPT
MRFSFRPSRHWTVVVSVCVCLLRVESCDRDDVMVCVCSGGRDRYCRGKPGLPRSTPKCRWWVVLGARSMFWMLATSAVSVSVSVWYRDTQNAPLEFGPGLVLNEISRSPPVCCVGCGAELRM